MKRKVLYFVFLGLLFTLSAQTKSRGLGIKKTSEKASEETDVEESQKLDAAQIVGMPSIELEENQICNVYALDFSPDGKYIVAGYNDSNVKIWEAKTGKQVKSFSDETVTAKTAHSEAVWAVAFSRDGKYVASGSADKTVKIWDVKTGNLLQTLKGHTKIVSFVTFSADNVNLASGSSDGTIKLWDVQTGFELQEITGHTKTIASISYSDSKRLMASASWDGTAKIYFAQGGRELKTLKGHTSEVFAVDFSIDEKYIATGSADRTVKLWDTTTGQEVKTSEKFNGEVWDLNFSKDGRFLIACDSAGTVKVLNPTTLEVLRSLEGHKVSVRSVGFSLDTKYLATGDSGGLIKIWDTETWNLLATLLQCKNAGWVTWTPAGFLTGSDDAIEKLSYTVQGKKYSLQEIKETVVKPDMVAATLAKSDKVDREKSFMDILMEENVPEIDFSVTNADGTKRTDSTNRDVVLRVKIKNTGGGIGRVFVKLNGRLIQLTDKIESEVGETKLFYSPTPISLRNGDNTLAVVGYNAKNKNSGTSKTESVKWDGNVQKSRLFILAAGVNNYKDKNIPALTNCIRDAEGLVEVSKMYAGDLYTNIYTKILRDGEVTKLNLIEEIRTFGENVAPDDVFILYIAGHGITHTDGDYYFIPQNLQVKDENSIAIQGVSKWELMEALSVIKAENMTVILDTCNSASFHSSKTDLANLTENTEDSASAGDANKSAIIDRFAAQAGYDLIAACSSTQVALDEYEGHGLFTHCIINAIKGGADLDLNGQITSAEFATYVIKEVPVLGMEKYGYKQEPQRSQPLFDYPMFGKLNPKDGKSLEETLAIARIMREQGLTLEEATAQLQAQAANGGVSVQQAAAGVIGQNVALTDSILPNDSGKTAEELDAERKKKQKALAKQEKVQKKEEKVEQDLASLSPKIDRSMLSEYENTYLSVGVGFDYTGVSDMDRNGGFLVAQEFATKPIPLGSIPLQPLYIFDLSISGNGCYLDMKYGLNYFFTAQNHENLYAGLNTGLSFDAEYGAGVVFGWQLGIILNEKLDVRYTSCLKVLEDSVFCEDQIAISWRYW